MNKKPDDAEVSFQETDVDSYQPDEIKRAEDIIKRQVQNTSYVPPSFSSPPPQQPIVAQERPPFDLEKRKREKEQFIQSDELTRLIRNGANSFSLLDKVVEEVAQDAASLKFDQTESHSSDTTKITKARTAALKLISDLVISKKELAQDTTINLRSKKVEAVFDYFFQVVRSTMAETESITVEQREMFWAKLHTNLANFEENAQKVMDKVEED